MLGYTIPVVGVYVGQKWLINSLLPRHDTNEIFYVKRLSNKTEFSYEVRQMPKLGWRSELIVLKMNSDESEQN